MLKRQHGRGNAPADDAYRGVRVQGHRVVPDLHAKTWALTHKWSDTVLFLNYETLIDSDRTGARFSFVNDSPSRFSDITSDSSLESLRSARCTNLRP